MVRRHDLLADCAGLRLKRIEVIKKAELEEGQLSSMQQSDEVMFEIELEYVCEQDPTVWEELADREWESTGTPLVILMTASREKPRIQ